MKVTKPLINYIESRVEKRGSRAEYARAIGRSGAWVSDLLNGKIDEIKADSELAISAEANIGTYDLISIGNGFVVRKVSEHKNGPIEFLSGIVSNNPSAEKVVDAIAKAFGYLGNPNKK